MGVIFGMFSGDELFVGHSIIFEMLKFKGVSWGQNDRGHVSFQGSKFSPTWSFQSDRPMVGSNLGNVSLVIWTKSAPNKTQAKNAFKIVVWNTSKHGGRWCFQTFFEWWYTDIHSFYVCFVLFWPLSKCSVASCEKLTWNILQVQIVAWGPHRCPRSL